MIALLCSVQAEAEQLLSAMTVLKTAIVGSKTVTGGVLGNKKVLLCVGGMGKVNAAHTATILAQYQPKAIIMFGIGGAYPSSGAKVGDVALAKEEIAGDEGVVTLDGFKDTEFIGIPLLKTSESIIYSTYQADESLLARSRETLAPKNSGFAVHSGTFVTLSTCTGTNARAKELEKLYRGLCENMEGAAVAQVAAYHKIPWMELRGISNIVEDRDIKKWDVAAAARAAQQSLIAILEQWPQ
jgi:futalosine hydrolase